MEELIGTLVDKMIAMTERAVAAETDLDNALSEAERLEAEIVSKEKAITALKEEMEPLIKKLKEEEESKLYWYRKFTELEEQVIKEKEEEKSNG